MFVSMSAAKHYAALLLLPVTFLFTSSSASASCDQYAPQVLHAMSQPYQYDIVSAARSNGVNPNLLKAVITAESCFRPSAVSNKGAGGLMQLMPATARRFGVYDRFDTSANIEGGARYLHFLLARYGGSIPHAVAAYNAGEGRVDVYGTAVPIEETQTYTRRVLNAYQKLSGGYNAAAANRARVTYAVAHRVSNNAGSNGACRVNSRSMYTVHNGDTVQSIARRYGMDAKRFVRLNGIGQPYFVEPGQHVRVERCLSEGEGQSQGVTRSFFTQQPRMTVRQAPVAAKKANTSNWGFEF